MARPTHDSTPWPVLLALLSVLGCGGDSNGDAPANSARPDAAGAGSTEGSGSSVWFQDVALSSGVRFQHGFGPTRLWMPEVAGSGLALFDMEGDGDLDLYALQGCDLDPDPASATPSGGNRLFENQGDGSFIDVTEEAGVGDTGFGMGCAVGDYDGDGRLDLYVTNLESNVLYRNLGDGRFEDVTQTSGTACSVWSTSAAFVDYDLDGHLDLYVVNYLVWDSSDEAACKNGRGERTYCDPNRYQSPERDTLFRNRGDGTFEDVSEAAGLGAAFGNGLGLVWGHLDDRPGVDFYVANDGMPNQLWSASGNGTFEDRAMVLGCALSGNGVAEAGMGACMEDMDRDGKWDLLVTHLSGETNTFYMSSRRGYRDRTSSSGTMGSSLSSTGFGVGMADFDHDGWLDVYVANGRVTHPGKPVDRARPLAEYDQVYSGKPGGGFTELDPGQVQSPQALTVSRGAAFGDIDGDGDVDVCINDYCGQLRILRNVAPKKGASLTLSVLEKDGQAALGAVVRFRDQGTSIQRQVQRAYSYCASNDPRLHFGLEEGTSIEQVEITWLDGTKETFGPVAAGGRVELKRGTGDS